MNYRSCFVKGKSCSTSEYMLAFIIRTTLAFKFIEAITFIEFLKCCTYEISCPSYDKDFSY